LTRQHDGCDLQALEVEARDLDAADMQLPAELKEAIRASALRIAAFHNAAAGRAVRVETAAGVVCERVARPVRRVGLYVPAGSSPLPSTALMLGIPARLAGCSEVVLCSPPDSSGQITPPFCMRPGCAASGGCSGWAAPRPLPPWLLEPKACRPATRFL